MRGCIREFRIIYVARLSSSLGWFQIHGAETRAALKKLVLTLSLMMMSKMVGESDSGTTVACSAASALICYSTYRDISASWKDVKHVLDERLDSVGSDKFEVLHCASVAFGCVLS